MSARMAKPLVVGLGDGVDVEGRGGRGRMWFGGAWRREGTTDRMMSGIRVPGSRGLVVSRPPTGSGSSEAKDGW